MKHSKLFFVVAAIAIMISAVALAACTPKENETIATESEATAEPKTAEALGNTSGNIVNGGNAVETEHGTYFISNGYHVKLAGGSGYEQHGAIYRMTGISEYEKVYSRDEHISNLNYCTGRFYFTVSGSGSGGETSCSLMSIQDDFDPETLEAHCVTAPFAFGSVNATAEYAYLTERTADGGNIVCVDYASGDTKRIYNTKSLGSLNLYESRLYFLVGDDSSTGACSRIVCTDMSGENETVLYTSKETLRCLNVGQEGLTFVESDLAGEFSTVRRISLDGNDSGLSLEMPYTYVNGLNVYNGSLYCLTTERRTGSGPTEQGTLRLIDLSSGKESTTVLDGISEISLCIASDYAFFTRGFDIDDAINPPVPLPNSSGMTSNENTQENINRSDKEEAYARNPSSVQNIDERSHNCSEYAELTGEVNEYEGRSLSGTPATVYALDLPEALTVLGTKYGDITSDKIILPESLFSGYVGETITLGAQYGIRVSESAPARDISMIYALQTDDIQPVVIREFD